MNFSRQSRGQRENVGLPKLSSWLLLSVEATEGGLTLAAWGNHARSFLSICRGRKCTGTESRLFDCKTSRKDIFVKHSISMSCAAWEKNKKKPCKKNIRASIVKKEGKQCSGGLSAGPVQERREAFSAPASRQEGRIKRKGSVRREVGAGGSQRTVFPCLQPPCGGRVWRKARQRRRIPCQSGSGAPRRKQAPDARRSAGLARPPAGLRARSWSSRCAWDRGASQRTSRPETRRSR